MKLKTCSSLPSLFKGSADVQYSRYCYHICCCSWVPDHYCWQHFHHIRVLEANILSSYKLGCCGSTCWICRTDSVRNFSHPSASWRSKHQQHQKCQYFCSTLNNVFVCISIFPHTHFSGTCICVDLAALPSSTKYERLHLQWNFLNTFWLNTFELWSYHKGSFLVQNALLWWFGGLSSAKPLNS